MLVYEKTSLQLFLVGDGLENILRVKLTTSNNSYGGPCTGDDGHYQVSPAPPSQNYNSILQTEMFELELTDSGAVLSLPSGLDYHYQDPVYYFCVQSQEQGDFLHQGTGSHLQVGTPVTSHQSPVSCNICSPDPGHQGDVATLGRDHRGVLLPPPQWIVLRPQPRPDVPR